MVQFQLPDEALADLEKLRDFGPDRLEALAFKFEDVEPTPLRPAQLRQVVSEALDVDDEAAHCVVRFLLALYGLRRRRLLDASEVMEGLRYAVSKAGWGEEESKRWDSIQKQLDRLLDIDQVWAVSKALSLAYEYPNLYQSARIITDIRPVFDVSGEMVVGSVVSYTLQVHYDDAHGSHSLSVVMDQEDVDQLGESCERAKRKAGAAKGLMDKAEVPVIVTGEDVNGT